MDEYRVSVSVSKDAQGTGKEVITKLLSIIDLVRKDALKNAY